MDSEKNSVGDLHLANIIISLNSKILHLLNFRLFCMIFIEIIISMYNAHLICNFFWNRFLIKYNHNQVSMNRYRQFLRQSNNAEEKKKIEKKNKQKLFKWKLSLFATKWWVCCISALLLLFSLDSSYIAIIDL